MTISVYLFDFSGILKVRSKVVGKSIRTVRFICHVLKEVLSAHQGLIYFQNTAKTVIL